MAGRPIGRRHQEDVRRKIQATQLVNRLTSHALGKLKKSRMDASQVQAALGLLKKCLPDLAQVEHSGEVGGTVKIVQQRDAARVA